MKLNFVSLGCARNLVDNEIMLGRLREKGWTIIEDPAELVYNTEKSEDNFRLRHFYLAALMK